MQKTLKKISNNSINLAINGGEKTIKKKFKRFNTYNKKEIDAVLKVVKTGQLSGFIADNSKSFYGGYHVKKLEQSFARYFKTKYAISVNSWTSGLVCAVGALNIKPGDEIIVTPWTMVATATSIIAWGGIPVFSEIDHDTYCLDPKKIENKITKKTKAIIAVDIFGQSSDYKNIIKIAKKHKLKVISDTAQAIGSKYYNKYSGTTADIGGFSLNRHKHIQTGEGGVILTNDKKLAQNMFKIRNHGEVLNKNKKFRNLIGFNFRMGEMEAAIGLEQLKKLKIIIKQKQESAKILTKKLKKITDIKTPEVSKNNTHVYYAYAMQLTNKKKFYKKNFIYKALVAEGVPLENHYDGFLLDYFIYTDPEIYRKFPWKLSKIKKLYSKKNSIYQEINNLVKLRFLSIPFCEYEFNKKDIELIAKAFHKVFNYIKD